MEKQKGSVAGKLIIAICVVIAIFFGGYFLLDKVVVPSYFGNYGINDVSDLISVVVSLYKSPKESTLITNGYTSVDLTSAITKLQENNYKISDDGTIKKEDYSSFKGTGELKLSDKEFAAICNKLLENGMLVDALPNLNYLNTLNMSVLEVIITPDENSLSDDEKGYTSANISFILKIDTADICEQIATQMNTPLYLLNMIIPETMYFSVSYDIDLAEEESNRANGTIAINGRTAEQSELLINLLISFIFPEEDEMDMDKFIKSVGDVVLEGIDTLGDFKFITNVDGSSNSGILVLAEEQGTDDNSTETNQEETEDETNQGNTENNTQSEQ